MRSKYNSCVGCTALGLPCKHCGLDRNVTAYNCDKCGNEIDPESECMYICENVEYCKDCFREMLIDRISENEDVEISDLAALLALDYKEDDLYDYDEEDYDE